MREISHVIVRTESAIDSHHVDGASTEPSWMAVGRYDYDGSFERGKKRYLRFRLTAMPCVLDIVEEKYFRAQPRRNKIIYYK